MGKSKTWNCAMMAGKNEYGCAAAIASNDPAEYPLDGYGVEISSYGSDSGDVHDVCSALLDTFMKSAIENGITSVLIFSDVVVYPEEVHREIIDGCTLDFIVLTDVTTHYEGAIFDPKEIRRKMATEAMQKELDRLKETAGTITFEHPPLVPGQYVLYKNGERYELGRVKRVTDDGAFIWYSAGDTASKTPWDCIIVLENSRNIISTDLGGMEARDMFPDKKKGAKA